MTKTAFIGLGVMGYPMAGHLAKNGHDVTVYNRTSAKAEAWVKEHGGASADTPAKAADGCDVVFSCVGNDNDLRSVVYGDDGILAGMKKGAVYCDHTTASAIAAREIDNTARDLGIGFLDGPVSGGQAGAENGALTIMVGGEQKTFDKVNPLFELMGQNITLVGGNGDGQTCKVANQIIVALNIEAVGEALLFASKAGADPAKVREALMGGFASSKILEVHGERMIKRRFDPGFRIELHQKDLNLALSGARALGLSLPNTATAQELFNACASRGGGTWDHSAMVKALELLADHEVA